MKRASTLAAAVTFSCVAIPGWLYGAISSAAKQGPVIDTEDVARFYRLYDAAQGKPTADQLQHDYIDPGSVGFHRLAELRDVTAARMVANLEQHPEMYSDAKRCMAVLPRARLRLDAALRRLARLDAGARFPPVTIAVGRGKPVGVADSSGVMIGLESLCATNWLNPNVEDRFVYVIAHEYVHVQQALEAPAFYNDDTPTVLGASLVEGAAEFTGELISGSVSYQYFKAMTRGKERQIETAFVNDEDKTDLSSWLYNGTPTKPADLGYWVGYRIVKSYYRHAADKRLALREILTMSDPKAFLAKSGWYPGIRL